MKKLISLLLAVILTVGLCACSLVKVEVPGEDASDETLGTDTIRANFDKAADYIDSIVGDAGMTTSIQDDADGQELYKYWLYEDEVEDNVIPMDVEFAGVTITVGKTTVKELEDMGVKVTYDEDTVEPEDRGSLSVDKDGKTVSLNTEENTSGEPVSIKDLRIYGFWGGTDEFFMEFSYAGITKGSTLKDVIDALGVPSSGITLSASDFNTSLTLDYGHYEKEGNVETADTVYIYLIFDEEIKEATLGSIQFERTINVYDEEPEEE